MFLSFHKCFVVFSVHEWVLWWRNIPKRLCNPEPMYTKKMFRVLLLAHNMILRKSQNSWTKSRGCCCCFVLFSWACFISKNKVEFANNENSWKTGKLYSITYHHMQELSVVVVWMWAEREKILHESEIKKEVVRIIWLCTYQ